MLVIIKSAPDTSEGKRGLKLARDLAADVCLIQNGVYFAQKDRLEGFCGRAFVVEEDCRFRGLEEVALEKDISRIGYDELVDAIVGEDKVVGAFWRAAVALLSRPERPIFSECDEIQLRWHVLEFAAGVMQ